MNPDNTMLKESSQKGHALNEFHLGISTHNEQTYTYRKQISGYQGCVIRRQECGE